MGWKLSLAFLTLLTLASAVLPLVEARERSSAARMHEYERLERALEQYRNLTEMDDGEVLPPAANSVEPGDAYDGTPRLIRLLSLTGDLRTEAPPADSGIYEGELVDAVKRFQSRHGLEPDGTIGPRTLEQLNKPLQFRVHQLELALARWRRRPFDPRVPAIVLNIPEFRLRAYGGADAAGGDPELEMKVIVGEPPDHRTPLLLSHLDLVIFRPYWNVPTSIQRNELLPEIRRDRSWVSANRFELVARGGEVEPGADVTDNTLGRLGRGDLQLRQKPGPKNTLGLVKFTFPNEYGIYMHDTSAPWLFQQERRALSHGCIRVEHPEELAAWVLRAQTGWSRDRVDRAVRGKETIAVKVQREIQLVIMYCTAAVMPDGEVRFFDDIYGEDHVLQQQLKAEQK